MESISEFVDVPEDNGSNCHHAYLKIFNFTRVVCFAYFFLRVWNAVDHLLGGALDGIFYPPPATAGKDEEITVVENTFAHGGSFCTPPFTNTLT